MRALLDVGGGTGGLTARLVAKLGVPATVLDPTPEMVRYIPENSPVTAVLGVAEKMPLADASFDAALMCDALHHLRDQRAALREVARVVRPGGAVLVLDLDRGRTSTRAVGVVERLLGEPAAFLTPSELREMMVESGITGSCVSERGPSYHFLGTVD
jgi:demethylmenaquinone methyltransferase/2-methoxy-6-polyprenyl-1,4-benzoquinol methylase